MRFEDAAVDGRIAQILLKQSETKVPRKSRFRAHSVVYTGTAVEAQRRRWNGESPTKDAALADRDVSYNEYIHRLTTAWKRP